MTGPPRYGGPYGPAPPVVPEGYRLVQPKVRDRTLARKADNPYRGRAGASQYQRKAADLKASPEGQTCHICGGEIDTSMPPEMFNDSGYWTVDHDPPIADGGSLLEGMKPAHKGCNSSRGGRMGRARQGTRGSYSPHASYAEQQRDDQENPIYTPDQWGYTTTPHLHSDHPDYTSYSRPW